MPQVILVQADMDQCLDWSWIVRTITSPHTHQCELVAWVGMGGFIFDMWGMRTGLRESMHMRVQP